MKPATNRFAGRSYNVARVEYDNLVGHRHGLDLVVGDVDGGGPELLLQFCHLHAHLDPQRRIEIRQRLVEQKRFRLAHDRAPYCDALTLAARKLARLAVQIGRQVQGGGRRLHLAVDVRARQACHLQAERDVAADAHVRIERIGLEHHRQPALRRWHVHHVLAVDQDLTAGDILQSGDQAQERGFAAAGWPDEDHEGAVVDIQIGILDDVDRPERFADSLQRDLAHDP